MAPVDPRHFEDVDERKEWDSVQAGDWFHNEFLMPLEKIAGDLEDILTGKFLDSWIHPWSLDQLHELQQTHAAAVEAAALMRSYWETHYVGKSDD